MLLAAMLFSMAVIVPTSAQAGKKRDARVTYILKNLRLKTDVQAKFKPVLEAYLEELSDLKAPYKKLKDELEDAINANKLTAAQCDELFESKQKEQRAELDIRKAYYPKFKAVLPAMKAYQLMKLANDKVKK